MPLHWRQLWLGVSRLTVCTAGWPVITPRSIVSITACEGGERGIHIVGDERPVVIGCVSPQNGFVQFTPWWYGNKPAIDIWTDITVFDPNDPTIYQPDI
jgi:hypothetical protein